MRILKIRSWKDFGWFVLDQVGHGALGLAPVAPFARSWLDVVWAAAIILTVREIEQAKDTLAAWWYSRGSGWPDFDGLAEDLHLPDRFADVGFGTLLAVGGYFPLTAALLALGWI